MERQLPLVCVRTAMRIKHVVRIGGILFAYEHFKPGSGPCNVGSHAADGVGLAHSIDSCALKCTLCHSGLRLAAEFVDDNKIRIVHAPILCPASIRDAAYLTGGMRMRSVVAPSCSEMRESA